MIDNEAQILDRIKASDKAAFEILFRTYYSYLCNFAYTFLKDRDNSEEVVQDMFVAFWNKRDQIIIKSSSKSYLTQTIRNRCLNELKHQKVKNAYQSHQMTTGTDISEGSSLLEQEELALKIQEAINSLPGQQQRVFLLSREEGKKYKEIAEELGISVKTVENHMGKALELMRNQLSEYLAVLLVLFFEYLLII